MNPQEFVLQMVRIICEYPESPIFWESTAYVVNNYAQLYTDWRRGNSGFALIDEKHKIQVSLITDGLRIEIESPTNDDEATLDELRENSESLIINTLSKYGYDKILNAKISFFFYKKLESLSETLPSIIDQVFPNSDIRDIVYGKDVVDFGLNITFPVEEFWCTISTYSLLEHEISDMFTFSSSECGKEGMLVVISYSKPPHKERLTLEELNRLLRVPIDEIVNYVAKLIASFPDSKS